MLVSTTQNFNLMAWLKHRRYLTTGDLSRVTHAVLTLAASQTERRPAKVSHNPVLLFEAKRAHPCSRTHVVALCKQTTACNHHSHDFRIFSETKLPSCSNVSTSHLGNYYSPPVFYMKMSGPQIRIQSSRKALTKAKSSFRDLSMSEFHAIAVYQTLSCKLTCLQVWLHHSKPNVKC